VYEITEMKRDVKVEWKLPPKAFYDALGFEGMKDLMYRFYDEIYDSSIAFFFPQDEDEFNIIKEKNALFFIELCGGEKVYDKSASEGMDINEHILRVHDEFSIYDKSRYEWLGCMEIALRETNIDQKLKDEFWAYLEAFSKLTVNTCADGSSYYSTTSVN